MKNRLPDLNVPARERIGWVDLLRVIACFLVVFSHSCDAFVAVFDSDRATFLQGALAGSFVRACVPLFVMMSGVLLLPVLVLAVFARPSADDFIYAARTHAVVQQYGLDLPHLLRAAWDTNVYYYENWQGLYVSGFTLAFQPAIFGNKYYGVTLVCVLLPLFFCLYGLARCVVLRLDPAQRRLPWALALLLTFAFIEGMPAPVEGLYWFNGAMNYLPYFSLAVLNAGHE